jgi:three-Cys-motif partner protein
MASNNPGLYEGREQTAVKHFILRKYLERFAYIIGSYRSTLTYVDCFSGPWNAQSEEHKDTSFYIALEQLRRVRETYAKSGRRLNLRCLFLERDPSAFAKLDAFAKGITDAKVETINQEFENAIPAIVKFVNDGGKESFPFIFIDPNGWSGIYLETITPLLKITPSEVLVNFMTDPIHRFLESPQETTQKSFNNLFGSANNRDKLKGLKGQELEDEAIRLYSESLKTIGDFKFVCCATILYPQIDKTYFNLLYASRHFRGAQVFKEVEKQAMQVMENERAKAATRRRSNRSANLELAFGDSGGGDPRHLRSLRTRYEQRARGRLLSILRRDKSISYEDAWAETARFPLVWESDLKGWIRQWQETNEIELTGLASKQHVPRLGNGHHLIWMK